MAQLFGKNYQETGKSSSPLLLRSNGEIKLQWGNKFIDLIKNGKLNSQSDNILFTVSTKNDINKDGIYLVTEDNSIWFSLNGTILQLSDSGTTYVSYMTEQKTTAEQKYQALTNIGFYYKTLEEAQQANIVSGIIYIEGDNNLYYVKDGNLIKYSTESIKQTSDNTFDEIFISDLHIYKNGDMYISLNDQTVIRLQNNSVNILKKLVPQKDIYSFDYDLNKGYALYENNSKSILEVDSIHWRNIDNELPTMESIIDEQINYNQANIIRYYEPIESTSQIKGFLKYTNQYKVGDYVFIALNADYYTYVVTITASDNGDQTLSINQTVPLDYILTLTDVNGVKYSFSGQNTSIIGKFNDFKSGIMYYNGIEQPEFRIVFGNNANPKKQLIEFKILNINQTENSIIFDVNNESLRDSIVNGCYNSRVALSRPSSLYIENNAITLKERTEKKDELTDKTTISNITHTKIGEISEKQFEKQLNPSQDTTNQERPNVGIYSDNLIGLNPILYNSIFKGSYPKYIGNIPEKPLDQANDQNLLNLKWFKQLYNQLIPIGTIIMFNSTQNIPDGWCVCDGSNGTPNLIDKFIKAGMTLKEESIELTKYTNSTTETTPPEETASEGDTTEPGETTPEQPKEDNKYKLDAYSLIFIMKMK